MNQSYKHSRDPQRAGNVRQPIPYMGAMDAAQHDDDTILVGIDRVEFLAKEIID